MSADLESVDRRFQLLVDKIEEYRNLISQQTKDGNLDANIDSVSIEGCLRARFRSERLKKRVELVDKDIIEVLKARGIRSLRDLEDMISTERET